MPRLEMELTMEDSQGQEHVFYPLIDSEHVELENGMNIGDMIKEGVATPTIAHEETSFKVGKGNSDISSSIVDSSVGTMIIKGQTYQNILPEPSLRNSMNGKSMQKFNEGCSNINVVDGIGKSAVLKGRTLVDLKGRIVTSKTKVIENTGYIIKADINGVPVDDTWSNINVNPKYIKPNTNYFVKWDKIEGLFSNGYVTAYQRTGNVGLANDLELPYTSNKNYTTSNFIVFNTKDNTDGSGIDIRFHLNGTGTHSGEALYITITGLQVVEYQTGMENWDWKYFDGMASAKAPVLSSVGKNLFDGKFELGSVSLDTGSEVDFEGAIRTSYIKVKPNTNYCISRSIQTTVGVRIYDENKKFFKSISLSSNDSTMFTTPHGAGYIRFALIYASNDVTVQAQLEEGSVVTPHEAHKSNALSLQDEVVLHSLPNGVCDTYGVVTRECVQRIETLILKGGFAKATDFDSETHSTFTRPISGVVGGSNFYCDKLAVGSPYETSSIESITINSKGTQIAIRLAQSRLTSYEGNINLYLEANPITIQYGLTTPIVKTVDLSSSGNWEKVIFNGGENWTLGVGFNDPKLVEFVISKQTVSLLACIGLPLTANTDGERIVRLNGVLYLRILKTKLSTPDVEGFKQYLSQNPITLWYQATTSKANSVKEILSFANGHIQLASGVDNSLIPSIEYEVPTSNSYHLDLAKTGIKYTMKNMSGTFTIDGTQYNASANGTFTTPNTVTNKLMIVSAIQSKAMLLEGDATTKAIPYFKGIKSSFENCDKIEVLSLGKNLFGGELELGVFSLVDLKQNVANSNYVRFKNLLKVQPNTTYVVSGLGTGMETQLSFANKDKSQTRRVSSVLNHITFTTNSDECYIRMYHKVTDLSHPIQIEKSTNDSSYEPYKSNDVKIPLLFPLRSLPSGVYDEVIIDRQKNKATIIQRVGHEVVGLNDASLWGAHETVGDTIKVGRSIIPHTKANHGHDKGGMSTIIPYSWDSVSQASEGAFVYRHVDTSEIRVKIKQSRIGRYDHIGVASWLRDNNIAVLYELEKPITTEVDLEGYPYVFKDGHIFLNTEIVPQTTIKYSINQTQQIESQNEDNIRIEKQIVGLHELIGAYVQVQYDSTLLSLKLKLERA